MALNSYGVMDGSHTFTVAWNSVRFHDKNPVLYKALLQALAEATDIIDADKRAAAAMWIADARSKLPLDIVHEILAGSQVSWTLVPENTMKCAGFMHRVGSIKTAPGTRKDLFLPDIHDRPGS